MQEVAIIHYDRPNIFQVTTRDYVEREVDGKKVKAPVEFTLRLVSGVNTVSKADWDANASHPDVMRLVGDHVITVRETKRTRPEAPKDVLADLPIGKAKKLVAETDDLPTLRAWLEAETGRNRTAVAREIELKIADLKTGDSDE